MSRVTFGQRLRQALIKVRDGLRNGTYRPINQCGLSDKAFDMNEWYDRDATAFGCGTIGCIGGYAAAIIAKETHRGYLGLYSRMHEIMDGDVKAKGHNGLGLRELCFPSSVHDWNDITPEMAAQAIDNYLDTGDPDWEGIV